MTVDCQWIEKNLEALSCDRVSEEESQRARTHLQACIACRREVQALEAVDPLIKSYFQKRLQIARNPQAVAAPALHKGRVLGLTGAVAAVIVLVFVILTSRPPGNAGGVVPVGNVAQVPAGDSDSTPRPPKSDEPEAIIRVKPSDAPKVVAPRPAPAPAVTASSPDFLVTDPAGYSHGLDEFRGRTVVVGVWNVKELESIANLERLYKANSANPRFRLLSVAAEREAKPENTSFPVFYNQGSKLLSMTPGQFVLLNEAGAVVLRGSLTKDFDNLTDALRSK